MRVSKLWLQEWVNFSSTEQELAHQLTMAGLEVDSISPVAGAFNQVVVGLVNQLYPHPNAAKLSLCDVLIHDGIILRIVCGAKNVRAGLKVAVALIGAHLPHGLHIKESHLRGEVSQGMLCSAAELGLIEQAEGIIELDKDAPIGMDLRDYLQLNDCVLDIDLTPNRADCFSVLGIARELAALNQLPLNLSQTIYKNSVINDCVAVNVHAPEACARYCSRVIRQINTHAVTPLWIKERLCRSGLRLIHPVVDILNYVMIELGQPMHAFDLHTLNGALSVRFAHKDETLTLLDDQSVALNHNVLIIADTEKPLALAGIMGGQASAVHAETTDVVLESAFFNPIVIAGVARAYNLFSDSSQRFERGVDPNLQHTALERATELIIAITGGSAGPIVEHLQKEYLPSQIEFAFDTNKVAQLTGLKIPLKTIKQFLIHLGMVITAEQQSILKVLIPSYRFDIHSDVDLVEEVIRLYGYDNLPTQPIIGFIKTNKKNQQEQLTTQLAYWFKARGYHETITYSFVDPQVQEELYAHTHFMNLLNPISSELAQMRVGMWPGLMASMIYNIHRQQNAIQFFEIGVVFDNETGVVNEKTHLAGLLMGEKNKLSWLDKSRFFDFFDLKGDLEALFSFLKLDNIRFVPDTHKALHPGQSASICINEQKAGWIGVLHPRFSAALDLQQEVILFALDTALLINNTVNRYKPISKYPQIRRDLSFLIDKAIKAQCIEDIVRKTVHEDWLKSFEVFDVYVGRNIPQDKKSMAITMTLQSNARTLVDTEINLLIDAILKALQDEFSITLRD